MWWQGLRRHLPASHYVLLALLFFAGLEITFALQQFILPALTIMFGLMTVGVVLIRQEESADFHFTQAILPILAAVGLTTFALFLPASPLLHLYFAMAGLMLYFLLRFAARQAYPTWNWGLSAGTLFVDVAAVLGWHFHVALSLVAALFLVWLIIFLLAWQAMRRIPGGEGQALLLALATSFSLTELTWVLQFTPLHFFVQAGVVLIAYYMVFQVMSQSFTRALTRRDVLEYTVVAGVALTILLASAQWI